MPTSPPIPGSRRLDWCLIKPLFAGGITRLADLLFPCQCVACSQLVEHAATATQNLRYLCAGCNRPFYCIQPPICPVCGAPYIFDALERCCQQCRDLDPAFRAGRALFRYPGPAGHYVRELKYHKGMHLLNDIEQLMRRVDWLPRFLHHATLVPVPLHRRKHRERGFNQSLVLARLLSQVEPSARIDAVLQRVIDTPTQTNLEREQRQLNVENAFAICPASVLNKKNYIIVDDVFTTGSTLNACARTLRNAGVPQDQIRILSFAHG